MKVTISWLLALGVVWVMILGTQYDLAHASASQVPQPTKAEALAAATVQDKKSK